MADQSRSSSPTSLTYMCNDVCYLVLEVTMHEFWSRIEGHPLHLHNSYTFMHTAVIMGPFIHDLEYHYIVQVEHLFCTPEKV